MPHFFLFTVGFIATLFTIWKLSKEKLYSERVVFDTVILTSLGAVIGARLFYVIFHFDQFGINILKWLIPGLYPGMSISGALVGAGTVLWLLSDRKTVVPFPELVDVLTRTVLLVLPFVLVGLLFISPEVGKTWGITIPLAKISLATYPVTFFRFLATSIVLAAMTWLFTKKRQLAAGTYSTVAWFSLILFYFLIDFAKTDDVYYWKLSVDQWIYSVLILIVAIIIGFQIQEKAFFKSKK